jgi:hypothetical protein
MMLESWTSSDSSDAPSSLQSLLSMDGRFLLGRYHVDHGTTRKLNSELT